MSEPREPREPGGADAVGPLVSGRLLARNSVWNLAGQGLPLLLALGAIPVLVARLGVDRFAVLAVAWTLIGYFSLFDLGLSRALTHALSARLASGEREGLGPLVWTAMALMAVLGVAGGILLALLAPWIVRVGLNIPPALERESLHAFYLMACGLPWVIGMGGGRGVLEACQRFDLANLVRIPLGAATYLGPLLVLPFSRSLVPVVAVLVACRVIACVAHLWLCRRALPEMGPPVRPRRELARPLLRVGGWMTVSNVVSPLMVSADRFVIGALMPVAAVAYYATPHEAVTKLLLVPGAITGVVFPALSASFARDRERAARLFLDGARTVYVLVLPVTLLVAAFAAEGLELWLGPVFAAEGAAVLRWLAAGVLVNSLAQVAYAAVQASGRADLTARLHLAELPLYAVVLAALVMSYGVAGAAAAWTLRVGVDALALFWMAGRALGARRVVAARLAPMLVGGGVLMAAVSAPEDLLARSLVFAGALVAAGAGGWFLLLTPGERRRALSLLRRRTVPAS